MKKMIGFVVFGLVIALTAITASAECYSDGIRVGAVQKISKKGMVMKSWEGELVMEGVKGSQRAISNVWRFSVLDKNVASAIEDAAMTGEQVALKYCQHNPLVPHPNIDADYEITKAVIRK